MGRIDAPDSVAAEQTPLQRLASFRFAYAAIFAFLVAYAFTVEGVERLLLEHFTAVANEAVRVDPANGPVVDQIHQRMTERISNSRWMRWGDVRVRPLVIGADGRTRIYAGSPFLPPVADDLGESLLPARVEHLDIWVPHNSLLANLIMVAYAALLITTLIVYTRRLTDREQEDLTALSEARDALAGRAHGIETELAAVRGRLGELEPENELYAEEVDALALERSALLEKLERVENRERELRLQSQGADDLAEERRALEDLLEEATEDLAAKETEIEALRSQVKRSGKGKSTREDDLLERRFRTLYKNLEVDEHAIGDLVALRDESLKLRAEEAMKRLSDEPDQAVVRRKLGGLPPHLSIFELAFAGKGRIYYTKGTVRRFRILSVGAKNTQKTDLEYLSRLPKG